MLIAKLFLPIASPGLAALGMGVLGVASGAYNTIEIAAILVGIAVVAIAGVFTIRSNVAKIWREQAEGEKARVADLTGQIAEMRAANVATLKLVQDEASAQRELKDSALLDLAAANMRTDLTPCMQLLHEILTIIRPTGPLEVTGQGGGPVKVEETTGGLRADQRSPP